MQSSAFLEVMHIGTYIGAVGKTLAWLLDEFNEDFEKLCAKFTVNISVDVLFVLAFCWSSDLSPLNFSSVSFSM